MFLRTASRLLARHSVMTEAKASTLDLEAAMVPAAARYPKLHMEDRSRVDAKLRKMVQDGIGNLQVVTDFDATLTHPRGLSSWGVLEKSHLTTQEYRDRTYALYKKYYPLEIDPTLSIEEKSAYMVEWWTHASEVLMDLGLTCDKLQEMVQEANDRVYLRDGCDVLFDKCAEHGVPLLVFSAGIANVIDDIIDLKGLNKTQTHVISNRMVFDKTTKLVCGFEREEPIHVFNKQESLIFGTPFHDQVASRGNVILMGDSLGDVDMSRGMEHSTVFRIGFLNTGVGKNVDMFIPAYTSKFDIVLVGDGTVSVALQIFNAIASGEIIDSTSVETLVAEHAERNAALNPHGEEETHADSAPPPSSP